MMHAAKPTLSTPSPRPFLRSPGFIILAASVTAGVVAFRQRAATLRRNEEVYKAGQAPNGYLSVERSGGGV
ncbi:hypothetical protein LIA77_07363 [Sarocladium implicatum]|nr:hypothetical protein LIA77_07363 [Sarocladium implicatum]